MVTPLAAVAAVGCAACSDSGTKGLTSCSVRRGGRQAAGAVRGSIGGFRDRRRRGPQPPQDRLDAQPGTGDRTGCAPGPIRAVAAGVAATGPAILGNGFGPPLDRRIAARRPAANRAAAAARLPPESAPGASRTGPDRTGWRRSRPGSRHSRWAAPAGPCPRRTAAACRATGRPRPAPASRPTRRARAGCGRSAAGRCGSCRAPAPWR